VLVRALWRKCVQPTHKVVGMRCIDQDHPYDRRPVFVSEYTDSHSTQGVTDHDERAGDSRIVQESPQIVREDA
jgi:hypothetical protein